MQAQVNSECPWGIITALEGNEYTRRDWRQVPAGREDEAAAHPWLDVREDPEPETDEADEKPASKSKSKGKAK